MLSQGVGGVVQEVQQDLLEQNRMAPDRQGFVGLGDAQPDPRTLEAVLAQQQSGLDAFPGVEHLGVALHLAPEHPQVFDDGAQAHGVGRDPLRLGEGVGSHFLEREILLLQRLHHVLGDHVHHRQRLLQFMRDGGGNLAQGREL